MKLYECGGKIFTSMEEACSYASFIHKISLIILGVFEIKTEKLEMTKLDRFQGVATSVKKLEGSWGKTFVGTYHSTDVASVENDKKVHLNTGGWFTNTTKVRMNQFANHFCGGRFSVYQKNHCWFVRLADGRELPFSGNTLDFEV